MGYTNLLMQFKGEEEERLHLLHIAPSKHYKSILKKGLTIGNKASGYGKAPTQKAVYLFHENNINVFYEMVQVFKELDVWEVVIDTPLFPHLLPDEDSRANTWEDSLNRFGTVAVGVDIPPDNLRFLCRINKQPK